MKKTLTEHAVELERAKRQAKRTVDAEERPARPPLEALTVAELYQRATPDYLVDQILPAGALAEFVGDSETLKSFFAIHLGLTIASGCSQFFDYPVTRHGPVLYIAAEGAGAFQFRLRAWGAEHRVDLQQIPFRTIIAPVNLRDPEFQDELRAVVQDVRPVLIIVDTLHRCIPGAEENSSRDVGEVVGLATRLQAESGAAILFLHHPPKSDPAGRGRGSGALYYAADTELSAVLEGEEAEDGTKVVTVSVKKQKDDMKVSFALKNRIVDVADDLGRPMAYASGRSITSCVLDLATEEDIDAASSAPAHNLAEQVVAFVAAHPKCSISEIRVGVKAKKNVVTAAVKDLTTEGRLTKTAEKRGRNWRDEYSVAQEAPCALPL